MIFGLLIATFGLFYALGYIHAYTAWKRHHDAQMVKNNTAWRATWQQERESHNATISRVLQQVRTVNKEMVA
jgi:hypothetical protein